MAIKSYGYPGSINAAALALWLPVVSAAQYSVGGPGDWRVSARSGADRGITIAKGTGAGDGIMDVLDADVTNLAIPASGSGSQWSMVVARRNWSTGATTFAVVPGSSQRQLPTRKNDKGELTEQPLALCRVDSGSATVSEFVDLRVWGRNGGMFALDELVKNYLTEVGTSLIIGGVRHDLVMSGLSPVWRRSAMGGAVSYDHSDWVNNRVQPISTSPNGSNVVLARLAIPDPGFPYLVQAHTAMEGGAGASRWDGILSVSGQIVSVTRGDAVAPFYIHQGITLTPITGASTVQLEIARVSGSSAFGLTAFKRWFRATVLPAI